jgi:hypothetical protein
MMLWKGIEGLRSFEVGGAYREGRQFAGELYGLADVEVRVDKVYVQLMVPAEIRQTEEHYPRAIAVHPELSFLELHCFRRRSKAESALARVRVVHRYRVRGIVLVAHFHLRRNMLDFALYFQQIL